MRIFRTAVGALSLAMLIVILAGMWAFHVFGTSIFFGIGLLLLPGALGTLLLIRRARERFSK